MRGPPKDGSGLYTIPYPPLRPEPLPLPSRKWGLLFFGALVESALVKRPGSGSSKPSSSVDKVTWRSRGSTGVTPCGSVSSA